MVPGHDSHESEVRPGVSELDHTADLGMRVVAGTREALFERAALGMVALMWADEEPAHTPGTDDPTSYRPRSDAVLEQRRVELRADALDTLLARWLQEVLYLCDAHALLPVTMEFDSLSDSRLSALVGVAPAPNPPARELKGVTYHGLEVKRAGSRWTARVIFDI